MTRSCAGLRLYDNVGDRRIHGNLALGDSDFGTWLTMGGASRAISRERSKWNAIMTGIHASARRSRR